MSSVFPLRFTVWVSEVVETTDRFGNTRMKAGGFRAVKAAGWAVNRVDEAAGSTTYSNVGESVLRTVDQLDLYVPQRIAPSAQIKLPDDTIWEVQGHAEDYRNGPFWDPGLVVVHARKVEG